MITKQQQKQKYQKDERYHSDFDNISQSYTNRYSIRNKFGLYFEQRKAAEIISLLNFGKIGLKDKKILDIGCHRGSICNLFAQLKGTSKDIYGIDFISEFVSQALMIKPGVTYSQADIYAGLNFKNGELDLVSLIYLYNALPIKEQKKVSKMIDTKIKLGGYIIFFDFYDSLFVRLAQRIAHIGKRYTPLPKFKDVYIKKLFPNYKIVKSKKMINILTYRSLSISSWLAQVLDLVFPKEYYICLLKKVR